MYLQREKRKVEKKRESTRHVNGVKQTFSCRLKGLVDLKIKSNYAFGTEILYQLWNKLSKNGTNIQCNGSVIMAVYVDDRIIIGDDREVLRKQFQQHDVSADRRSIITTICIRKRRLGKVLLLNYAYKSLGSILANSILFTKFSNIRFNSNGSYIPCCLANILNRFSYSIFYEEFETIMIIITRN